MKVDKTFFRLNLKVFDNRISLFRHPKARIMPNKHAKKDTLDVVFSVGQPTHPCTSKGCSSTFGKRKKTRACFSRFPKNPQHSPYMYEPILHGKLFENSLMKRNPAQCNHSPYFSRRNKSVSQKHFGFKIFPLVRILVEIFHNSQKGYLEITIITWFGCNLIKPRKFANLYINVLRAENTRENGRLSLRKHLYINWQTL